MRQFHTGVCGVLCAGFITGCAAAQTARMPYQGGDDTRSLALDAQFMVMTDSERALWLDEAVSQLVQEYAQERPHVSHCTSQWRFDIQAALRRMVAHKLVYVDDTARVTFGIAHMNPQNCKVTLRLDTTARL